MSEEPRLWPALLVAAIVVLSIAAVMFIGTEDDESEPRLPEDLQLVYSASVVTGNLTVHGTQTMNLTEAGNSGWTHWEAEGFWAPSVDFPFYGGQYLLDEIEMDTPWGVKSVCRTVSLMVGYDPELRVTYSGSGSHLTYREDILSEGFRATFLLSSVNFTGMPEIDNRPCGDGPFPGYSETQSSWTLDGGYSSAMMAVDEGPRAYRINVTGYDYYHFGQDDVMAMVGGGSFRYDTTRSVIGNGTVEFVPEGDWFLRFIEPEGDGPHQFHMETWVGD